MDRAGGRRGRGDIGNSERCERAVERGSVRVRVGARGRGDGGRGEGSRGGGRGGGGFGTRDRGVGGCPDRRGRGRGRGVGGYRESVLRRSVQGADGDRADGERGEDDDVVPRESRLRGGGYSHGARRVEWELRRR